MIMSHFQVLTRLHAEYEDDPDNEGISTEDLIEHLGGLLEPSSVRRVLKEIRTKKWAEKVGEIKREGEVGRPMNLYKITKKGIKELLPHLAATRDIGG